MRRWLLATALAALATGASAQDDAQLVGHYYLQGVHEVGSELLLGSDHRFEWMLAYGALDQVAHGRWSREGARIVLVSDPLERTAHLFSFAEARPWSEAEEQQLRDRDSSSPDGGVAAAKPTDAPASGIALTVSDAQGELVFSGVHAHFEFDHGAPVDVTTGRDGRAVLRETRQPRAVTLTFPAIEGQGPHAPERFNVPPAPVLLFKVDTRALIPSSFERMELTIDGRDLRPGPPVAQGHYSRD